MCHWIVTGVTLSLKNTTNGIDEGAAYTLEFPGRDSEDNQIGNARELEHLVEYLPPSPPPKTGSHRYVFVLLAKVEKGEGDGRFTEPAHRPHWGYGKVGAGVKEWAGENGLIPIGK